MRRLTVLMVLVAFIFSCGGQWPVLQCVAWANMVREYSEMVPLGEAVEMTFSGQYPCAMCKAITEKRQSENAKALTLHKQEKLVCSQLLAAPVRTTTVSPQGFVAWNEFFRSWSEAPPTPPPRSV